MPAAASAFLTVAEVMALLGIPERTFYRHYLRRFTDGRPADRRTRRVPHAIRRAEVELVIERGWEALAERREAAKFREKMRAGR